MSYWKAERRKGDMTFSNWKEVKSMKLLPAAIAFFVYFAFVMLVPHKNPMLQGVESDFACTYVLQAQELFSEHKTHAWSYHGTGYPLLLNLFALGDGKGKDKPEPGYHYFRAAKLLSAMSGAFLVALPFLFWGWAGLFAVIALAVNPWMFQHSYTVGTDMVALALVAGALYLLLKHGWWKILLAGCLFALGVSCRHEFIVLLPIYGWLVFQQRSMVGQILTGRKHQRYKLEPLSHVITWYDWRYLVLFLVPIVLYIAPDSRSWTSHCIMPFKYLSEGLTQDQFPPQMFDDLDMDYVENYYTARDSIAGVYYPTVCSTISADPGAFVRIFLGDNYKGLLFLLGETAILLIAWMLGGFWRGYEWQIVAALALHFIFINFAGIYNGRLFLLEIFTISAIGGYTLWRLRPGKWAVMALVVWIGLLNINTAISKVLDFSGDRFRHTGTQNGEILFRSYVDINEIENPTLLSVRAQPAFIAGWNWHPFPPGLDDLYGYCQRFEIDYVLWSGFEQRARLECAESLLGEQFEPIDYADMRGTLFMVVDESTPD